MNQELYEKTIQTANEEERRTRLCAQSAARFAIDKCKKSERKKLAKILKQAVIVRHRKLIAARSILRFGSLIPHVDDQQGTLDLSPMSKVERDANEWMATEFGKKEMEVLVDLVKKETLSASFIAGIPVSFAWLYEVERARSKEGLVQGDGRKIGGYTLSNSHRAYISRRIMATHPELAGVFELRPLRSRHEVEI